MKPFVLLTCIALLFVASACTERSPSIETQARSIEGQVWSPYCPGRLLIDCTTPQARGLRAEIERRLESGEEPGEVLTWIRRNHGDEALAGASGPGLWLVALGLFAAGGALLATVVARWRRQPARATGGLDAANVERLRDEIRRDI